MSASLKTWHKCIVVLLRRSCYLIIGGPGLLGLWWLLKEQSDICQWSTNQTQVLHTLHSSRPRTPRQHSVNYSSTAESYRRPPSCTEPDRSGELCSVFDSRWNLRCCIVSHQYHHHLVLRYQTTSCFSLLLFISGRLLCPTGSTGSPSGAWRWLWLCWIKWAARSGWILFWAPHIDPRDIYMWNEVVSTHKQEELVQPQNLQAMIPRCRHTTSMCVCVCVFVCGGLIIPFPSPHFFSWSLTGPFHDFTHVKGQGFPSFKSFFGLWFSSLKTCDVLFSPQRPPLGCYF